VRRVALLILGAGALLLTPGAPGLPDVPGDPTPPTVTPLVTGTLGSEGWYTSNVTVNWAVADPESIILSTVGCDARTLTADTTGTRLTCTAESDGGETSVSKTIKLDKTAPAASATPSRAADANGWYNHDVTVAFAGSDSTSGLGSCSPGQTYGGPDNAVASLTGTCRDRAGNATQASFPFKYDETAPQASPGVRPPDANGWYNHAVTVAFQGSDGTSGVGSCTEVTYAGPDDPSVALSGTCVDEAGNRSSPAGVAIKYDETAPQAAAAASRAPDVNGWYNHALTVSFAGDDEVSGLDSCDAPKAYSGPDADVAVVGGSCRDVAGNVSPRSLALKYDSTPPAARATPSWQPNANGWYSAPLSVSFAGTDATSGNASCAAAKSYSGPDDASATVNGTCTDNAGNVGAAVFAVKYDATGPQTSAAPSRQPNANGWYRAPLTITFSGTDATSGIESCDAVKAYSGPDAAAADVSGACRDRAGNSSGGSFALRYDATAPTVSAAPGRAANAKGWYSAPVAVSFTGADVMSGLDACEAAKTYSGPDSSTASIAGNCLDQAGNTGSASLPLKYDATAPQTTATPSRQANVSGWHNAPVTATFTGTDATAGIESCDPAKSFSGPDVASTALTGACRDNAGNASAVSLPVKYDATPPIANATPSRGANANGWYNAPLAVAFAATDATSGVDSCPPVRTYSGPDDGAAVVSGTCADRAGNGGVASLALKYDATAPQASATPLRQPNGNGWYREPLAVSFAATDATSGVDSCPPVRTYSGPDDGAAVVGGTCVDKAGNGGVASLALKYDATAPQASATPLRQPNGNGWYREPLAVSFAATDATSGLDSCPSASSYSGPDDAAAVVSGICLDKAGNGGLASLALKYDATAPLTTATPVRQPNAHGWYNAALSVTFAATDATAGVDTCDPAKSYAGPDGGTAAVSGTCRDRAGNAAGASLALKYDSTAPQTSATPSRQPNGNGWYNAPLTVSFAATDATSTVDSCDAAKTYSGPDGASATVAGTCHDKAGNAGAVSLPLKYDATAPQTTATPSRQPNGNGWYNAPLTVSFAATDAASTVESCDAAKTYSGPESTSTAVTGTCRDKAGNAGGASIPLKYDATAPQASATPSREPDANGWYNASLSVSFAGSDALSGLESCAAAKSYSGPDDAAAVVDGICRDKAGNGALATYALKYDATAPTATATPAREPNEHGWYKAPLTVTFVAADPLSGLDSCPAATRYEGPDDSSALVSGTCRDNAGNGAVASLALKYDATAPATTATPSRQPNANGWYNAALAVAFSATDETSGTEACTPPQSYSGPDSADASRSGSCTDRAGNASSDSFAFRYDATPPTVASAVPVRPPDRAGWYNRPVVVDTQGSDAASGIATCPSVSYTGPDGNDVPVAGTCLDRAGNVGFRRFSIDYDSTGPAASAAASRVPDANGWYNRALTVTFTGSDPVSGLDSCAPPETYDGPDTASAVVSGICLDKAGNAGVTSYPIQYDATPPQVTGVMPERQVDAAGWYNHPLAVSFQGSDATSGVDTCTRARYAGPDAPAATVSGSCADRAGNGSPAASFALRYDATAPTLGGVHAKGGNRVVTLSWTASPDTAVVELRRSGQVVYRGTGNRFTDARLENGKRYGYMLTGYDEAGNAATASAAAIPTAPLISPAAGAKVTAPPRLVWAAVPKATYYHVQLWRRGRILSAWPSRTSLRLSRTWAYAGRRYHLTPGRYRWFVWPAFGRRAEKRFGPLLGSSSFVVR
jgi:large repetitive protein